MWDLGNFLQNSTSTIRTWGGYFFMLLGVVLMIVAIWQIGSGLMSHGKKQVNWAMSIIMLLIGGVLAASSSFAFVEQIAGGGRKTIEDLGRGGLMVWQNIKFLL